MENLEDKVTAELDAVNHRLLDWVDRRGRSNVGRAIGKKPNLFANLAAGTSKSVSLETIKLLSQAYGEEFPEVYILTGSHPDAANLPTDFVASQVALLEAKIREDIEKRYRDLLNEKEARIKTAEQTLDKVLTLMGKAEDVTDDPSVRGDFALMRQLSPYLNYFN